MAAHSLSYLFVSVRAAEGGAEASERATTGGAAYLPPVLGILTATALVAVALTVVRRRRRHLDVSPWVFFVMPPLAFVSQELGERLLHAEAFPFQAALEPRFLLGLLLQLPFGLLALLVARALLRVVERLVRALTRPGVPREATASWSLPQVCDLPRIPALALGYPQRGPPAL